MTIEAVAIVTMPYGACLDDCEGRVAPLPKEGYESVYRGVSVAEHKSHMTMRPASSFRFFTIQPSPIMDFVLRPTAKVAQVWHFHDAGTNSFHPV